jgi:methyl-accepting chemotaxis protein
MKGISLIVKLGLLVILAAVDLVLALAAIKLFGAAFTGANLMTAAGLALLSALLAYAAIYGLVNHFGNFNVVDRGASEYMEKYFTEASRGNFMLPIENLHIESGEKGADLLLGDFHRNITNVLSQTRRLTEDLGALSQQIIDQSENLSRAAGSQVQSVEETGQGISQIDQGIREIHERVDGLKNVSQETSAASFEMMTNIQQVSELAGELAGFVRDLVTAISQMASNIKSVASASESLSATSTQTAVSIREIDQNTQEIQKRAVESARIAAASRERGIKAGELIGVWAEGMEKIESAVSDSTRMMAELS